MKANDTASVKDHTILDLEPEAEYGGKNTSHIFNEKQHVSPRSTRILCIDLTDNYFKYALYSKSGKSIRWLMAGRYEEFSLEFGAIKEMVSAGISELSNQIDLKNVKILIIAPGTAFFIRQVEVPVLRGNNLLQAVRWECSKQIPYSIDDAYIRILSIEKAGKTLLVQAGINLKSLVDNYEFLGDRLLGVVFPPLSSCGTIHGKIANRELSYVVVYWGQQEAVISFAHKGRLAFSKGFSVEGLVDDKQLLQSTEMLDRIKRNLRSSMDFYLAHFPNREIGEVMVYGPGNTLLIDKLSASIGINITCRNPFEGLIADQTALTDFYSDWGSEHLLCSGAIELNPEYRFLPSSLEELRKYFRIKPISDGFSISAAVAILLLGGALLSGHYSRTQAIESLAEQIRKIEKAPSYAYTKGLNNELGSMLRLISNLAPATPWAGQVLKGISVSMSPQISFNHLKMERIANQGNNVEMKIEGSYFGDIKGTEARIAELVEKLRHFTGFEQRKVDKVQESLEGDMKRANFTISGQTRGD